MSNYEITFFHIIKRKPLFHFYPRGFLEILLRQSVCHVFHPKGSNEFERPEKFVLPCVVLGIENWKFQSYQIFLGQG